MFIDLDITDDDLRAWMRYVLDSDGQVQQSRKGIQALTPLLLLLFGFAAGGWVGGLVALVAGVLMSLFFVPWALNAQFERRIEIAVSDLADGMTGRHTIELSADTITWTTSAVVARWNRSAIRKVHETDTHAFVMFSNTSAFIVPLAPDDQGERRAFLDDVKLNRMPPAS